MYNIIIFINYYVYVYIIAKYIEFKPVKMYSCTIKNVLLSLIRKMNRNLYDKICLYYIAKYIQDEIMNCIISF